ncbi:MAG: hypothetical protein ACPGSC_00045 [Granulosicoccaceae bacterium]
MNQFVTGAISLALLFGATSALACTLDTDCDIGSQCVKSDEGIYGACVGGLFPGNSEKDPIHAISGGNSSYGNSCTFDIDCDTGSRCVKNGGVFGACL